MPAAFRSGNLCLGTEAEHIWPVEKVWPRLATLRPSAGGDVASARHPPPHLSPPRPPLLLISGDGLGRVCQSVGWGRVVLYAQKPGWELTHQLT